MQSLIIGISLLVMSGGAVDAQGTGTDASGADRAAKRAERIAKFISKRDTDRDGRLSREEADLRPSRFARLDGNGDGSLDALEMTEATKPGSRFERRDTDKDGKLSREEADMRPSRFAKVDTNGDGSIDRDEAKTARERAGERVKKFRELRREFREKRRAIRRGEKRQ